MFADKLHLSMENNEKRPRQFILTQGLERRVVIEWKDNAKISDGLCENQHPDLRLKLSK